VGFAWDRIYLYATGGGAGAKLGVTVCNTVTLFCVSDSTVRWGWTVGAGMEWAFWDNWSFKAEYLHVDFGTTQFINPPVVAPTGGTVVTRNVPVTDDFFVLA
jgi:outer membrane immunogenic protein